jgi:hypothetical protein
MDMFNKLVDVNRKRIEDTPTEKAVLEAMRSSKRNNGVVEALVRQLPQLKKWMIYQAVGNLASRRKIDLLPGERWRIRPS